ncbi:MAG: lysine biosynthesis protein LysX [Phycisphaeraceae bacterium]|nr:lysine biosynthesis protein LysX [Phycisphaeraceae bacterium]MCB9847487.1 lysine biosynthesis protein LysX [Phycisphaeraceae bacterium]
MRIAMLYTRLRVEERLLLDAFDTAGFCVEPIDTRSIVLDPANPDAWSAYDAVFDRSLSLTASINIGRVLESFGLRVINPTSATEVCSDKLRTTLALERAGVPTPAVRVALDPESALGAVGEIGYPAVVKPTVGSWGRLVARINDRDAAEAIIEHRAALGSAQQGVYYVQEHIDKPGRDLRVFVVNHEPIAAIVRTSEHWVTNTARGAAAANFALSDEVVALAASASRAVGADLVAVDLLECPRRGLLVNELNHSMEFRNSIETTGVDIPGRLVGRVIEIAGSVGTASVGGAS